MIWAVVVFSIQIEPAFSHPTRYGGNRSVVGRKLASLDRDSLCDDKLLAAILDFVKIAAIAILLK